jgi:imidazole glycerol-phosphate synthase subunit HisF
VKDATHVQTRRLEGLRPVGNVIDSIEFLEQSGYTEFAINSVVATLYSKSVQTELVSQVRKRIFSPILYMGGVKTIEDAQRIIESGADRVGVNSQLFQDPRLLEELESELGAQSVVLQVDTLSVAGRWKVAHSSGREVSSHELESWLSKCFENFSGEALVTCIDTQGTSKGIPTELVELLAPWKERLIISGGLAGADQIFEISQRFSGFSFSSSNVCLPS